MHIFYQFLPVVSDWVKCWLQFDSGLYATAIVVDSAYKLAAASMSEAPMPEVDS